MRGAHVMIEGLTIRHGRSRDRADGADIALRNIDLDLQPGSFTALIGPSGCGKSTLVNAIAGFTPPAQGRVRIDGAEVHGPPPEVGVIFQQYALFPWLTVLGNVRFGLKQFRLGRRAEIERAEAALAEVGLADLARRYPQQLSGGQRQRVAIARTFATGPRVLLMDEPFGALDAQTRVDMQELLLALWRKRRATVLFVTHDVDEAILLADHVRVMSHAPGQLVMHYELTQPRPRKLSRAGRDLLMLREDILGLLRPPGIFRPEHLS